MYRFGKTIFRAVLKSGFYSVVPVLRAIPQVVFDRLRVDDFAGVH
jgi:hypothetical protein